MEHASIMNKKRRVSDQLLEALIYLCAFLAVGLLLGIIGYVFWRGFRTVNWSFLVTEQSPTKGIMGIAGNIVNTLYIVVLTLLAATPIGVGGAIYLNEYAKPGKFVSLVQFTIETLTGIPSIIFGLFGNVFFGKTGLRLFHAHRSAYPDHYGTAPDRQEYPGGPADRAGQL